VNYTPQGNYDDDSIPIRELKRLAQGRWREILQDAGIPSELLADRRGRPCPKCGGRDRFAALKEIENVGAVLCRHCFNGSTDPRAGDGLASIQWAMDCTTAEAIRWLRSWLGVGNSKHRVIHRKPIEPTITFSEPVQSESDRKYLALAADVYRRNLSDDSRAYLAGLLNVSSGSLERLRVGWCPSQQMETWPMLNADGIIIGIRLRGPVSKDKSSVKGGLGGLFYDPIAMASIEHGERVWITEGASDTAAGLTLGLHTAGVPSASGACDMVESLGHRLRPCEWVIVGDNDKAGTKGVLKLRTELAIVAPVRIIYPPEGIKDLREWLGRGLSRQAIEREADASEQFKLEWNGDSV
jgi:phage/plasmid primase-like uncharacterized protein